MSGIISEFTNLGLSLTKEELHALFDVLRSRDELKLNSSTVPCPQHALRMVADANYSYCLADSLDELDQFIAVPINEAITYTTVEHRLEVRSAYARMNANLIHTNLVPDLHGGVMV
jgi:hypothetical protein